MDPVNFLYNELESLSRAFPQVHIKYAYNNIILTHIVELLPLSEYQNNSDLDDAWIPLSFKFREIFPEDEIAFVSSDSSLRIEDSSFEFNVPLLLDDIISEFFAELSEGEYKYSFPTCIPGETIEINTSVHDVLSYPKQILKADPDDIDHFYQAAA